VRGAVNTESPRTLRSRGSRIYFFQDGAKYLMREVVITEHFSADDVKKAIENGLRLASVYEKWRRESGEE
jgi:hypothetical protein